MRWVKLPCGVADCPGSELHFVPCIDADTGLQGGVDRNRDGVVAGSELVAITHLALRQRGFSRSTPKLRIGCEWYINTQFGMTQSSFPPLS